MAESPRSPRPVLRALQRVVPIVVSGAILYYYLHALDWDALRRVASEANLPLAVAAIAVPQLFVWIMGARVIQLSIVWFHGPFPLLPFIWIRGSAYILMFINTALGGGAQVLYQQRRGNLSWTKLTGILLFRVGLGLWGICMFMLPMTLAVHLLGLEDRIKLDMAIWWGVLIGGFVWLVEAWLFWHHGRSYGLSRFLVRDRKSEFWTAFDRSTPRQWLIMWALGLPQMLALVLGYHTLNRAFGIDAPLVESLVVIPLVMVIMDLPIAFAGFGTATLAWTTFFSDYASVEQIAALTLILPIVRMLCRAMIGAISLKPAMADIRELAAAAEAAKQSPASEGEPPVITSG